MRTALVLAASLCCGAPLATQVASPRDLTGYLPEGALLVVDMADGAQCLERLMKLLDPLPQDLPPGLRLFVAGLPLLTKASTGLALADLLEVFSPGHTVFALVLPKSGRPYPVVLTRIAEPEEVMRVRRRIGKKIPAGLVDGILTISDSKAHLAEILAFRSSGRPALLASKAYRQGRPVLRPGKEIRVFVDLAAIRRKTGKEMWGRVGTGARLLVGPAARTLDRASRIDARLILRKDGLQLVGRADGDLQKDPIGVGRLTTGAARKTVVLPAETLAFLSLDRDLAAFLSDPERWLGADGAVPVQNFLSVADQFLGGSSLLTDLLPGIEMPMDLFVMSTGTREGDEGPRIRLPAISLVFGIPDEDSDVEGLLDRGARVITTIINAQRLQQKKVQVRLRRGRDGEYRYQSLRFGDWPGPGDPPTEHGLSPTLLFAHGHGILSSTAQGAVQIAKALATGKSREIRGDALSLRGDVLADLVRENESVLVTDRILKEGQTRLEARRFLGVLQSVLRILRLDASVVPATGITRFELMLTRER